MKNCLARGLKMDGRKEGNKGSREKGRGQRIYLFIQKFTECYILCQLLCWMPLLKVGDLTFFLNFQQLYLRHYSFLTTSKHLSQISQGLHFGDNYQKRKTKQNPNTIHNMNKLMKCLGKSFLAIKTWQVGFHSYLPTAHLLYL